jgi:hypothetical protein
MIVTYYANLTTDLGRRFFDGWEPGDPLVKVAAITVQADDRLQAAEVAFAAFQRIDDPHPLLDDNEAPSMSIGDVVVTETSPGCEGQAHAVRRLGFEGIGRPADLLFVGRYGRTCKEIREALAKVADSSTCEWFAVCERDAAGKAFHPGLGWVPVCVPCASNLDLELVEL